MHFRHGDPRHVGPRAVKGALVPAFRPLAQSHHAALARTLVDVAPGARVPPVRSVGAESAAQGGQCRVEPPACLEVSVSVVALTLSNVVGPTKHRFLSWPHKIAGAGQDYAGALHAASTQTGPRSSIPAASPPEARGLLNSSPPQDTTPGATYCPCATYGHAAS